MPRDESRSITRASSSPSSGGSRAGLIGAEIRTETTQSLHAISRMMQLSQSIIMKVTISGGTDIIYWAVACCL